MAILLAQFIVGGDKARPALMEALLSNRLPSKLQSEVEVVNWVRTAELDEGIYHCGIENEVKNLTPPSF